MPEYIEAYKYETDAILSRRTQRTRRHREY